MSTRTECPSEAQARFLAVLAVLAVPLVLVSACSKDPKNNEDGNDAGDTDSDVGAYQWHTFYMGAGVSLAVDSGGDIDVTGDSHFPWNGPSGESPLHEHSGFASDGDDDVCVLKSDSTGAYQWHTFYGSEGDDRVRSLTVDGDDNIYVAGWSDTTWSGPSGESPLHAHSGYGDLFVLKLDSSGNYLWHTFFGCPVDSWVQVGSLAVDSGGNGFVTGSSGGSWNGPSGETPLRPYSGDGDLYVLKLDSSGAYEWHAFFGSGSPDTGISVSLDSGGDVLLNGWSGASWEGPGGESPLSPYQGGSDGFVLKLDSNGSYQWHAFHRYCGEGDTGSIGPLALDSGDNLYVPGWSEGPWDGPGGEGPLHSAGAWAGFILALDPEGAYRWHTFYGAGGDDAVTSLTADGDGDLFITGMSGSSWNGPSEESPENAFSGDSDSFILALDSNGAYRWHSFYGGADFDYGASLAADGGGHLYVTGESAASWVGPAGQSPLNEYASADSEYNDMFVLALDI